MTLLKNSTLTCPPVLCPPVLVGGTWAGIAGHNKGLRGWDLVGYIALGAFAGLAAVGAGIVLWSTGAAVLCYKAVFGYGLKTMFAIGALGWNIAAVIGGPLLGLDIPVLDPGYTNPGNQYKPPKVKPTIPHPLR